MVSKNKSMEMASKNMPEEGDITRMSMTMVRQVEQSACPLWLLPCTLGRSKDCTEAPKKTPSPPPSKKRKTRTIKKTSPSTKTPVIIKMTNQPTKKTTRSHHAQVIKKFTIGTAGPGPVAGVKPGSVMKEKMRLANKIRKDKREKKIAEVRKPLLATPTRKRDRKEEGEWQPGTELQEARKITQK